MYLYYDKNGVLKEIINDEALRQGSSDYNTIYAYFEDDLKANAWITLLYPDLTTSNEQMMTIGNGSEQIPYSETRDLEFFKYFTNYKFYKYTLQGKDLADDGTIKATIRLVAPTMAIDTKGLIIFNVEKSIIKSDTFITQSQFDYLVKLFSSYLKPDTDLFVRKYQNYASAEKDLTNLKENELIVVYDPISFTFYYKGNGILHRILQSSVYAINDTHFQLGSFTYEIPTSLSQLINDKLFITKSDLVDRAIADSLGNVIAEYYLSKSDGATKSFVYNYAMPKSYAETYYYSKDGYLDLPPTTPADGVQFSKTFPIGQVLEEQVFGIERTLTAEYEFSKRNSSTSEIWIKSDKDIVCHLGLVTKVQETIPLGAVRIPVSLKANTLTKVIFSGNFTARGEQELKVNVGDKFYQTLSFSSDMQLETPTTISVISSITYPSSFSLDVQTQVIAINNIGEPKEMFVKSTDFVLNTGTEIYEAKILQRDHIQPIGNKYIVQGYIQETTNTYRIVNLDYDVNANGDITLYSSVAENYRVLIASRVDLDTRAVLDLTNPTSLNGIDFDKYGALKITQTTPLTNLTLQTPQYPNIAYRVFISNSSVSTQPISVNNNLIAIGTGVQYYWAGEWTKGVIPTNTNDIYDKAKSQTLDKSLVSLGTDIQEVSNKLPQYEKIETQDAISDFSIYTKPFIHIIYDIQQDNKVITQTLMPTANNQVVILEIQANGHTGIALQVQAAQGDQFAGTIVPSVFIENGVIGTAYPLNTHNWDFVACEKHIGGGSAFVINGTVSGETISITETASKIIEAFNKKMIMILHVVEFSIVLDEASFDNISNTYSFSNYNLEKTALGVMSKKVAININENGVVSGFYQIEPLVFETQPILYGVSPSLNEIEFNKHLLYQNNGELSYLEKEFPTTITPIKLTSTLFNDCYWFKSVYYENFVYRFDYRFDLDNKTLRKINVLTYQKEEYTLPAKSYYAVPCAHNGFIYAPSISTSYPRKLLIFNTKDNSYTETEESAFVYDCHFSFYYDNKIYSNLGVYDLTTKTFSALPSFLPMCHGTYKDIYTFFNNGKLWYIVNDTYYVINMETQVVEKKVIYASSPTNLSISWANVGDYMYRISQNASQITISRSSLHSDNFVKSFEEICLVTSSYDGGIIGTSDALFFNAYKVPLSYVYVLKTLGLKV